MSELAKEALAAKDTHEPVEILTIVPKRAGKGGRPLSQKKLKTMETESLKAQAALSRPKLPDFECEAEENLPLSKFLKLLERELPEKFKSIDAMHSLVLQSYKPNHLPARFDKKHMADCTDIATPSALFEETIGLQTVLMGLSFLRPYPYLRVIVLHNATVYHSVQQEHLKTDAENDGSSVITDLMWMLYIDQSGIAAKWDAEARTILTQPALPFTSASEAAKVVNMQSNSWHDGSSLSDEPQVASDATLQELRQKYKKRITETFNGSPQKSRGSTSPIDVSCELYEVPKNHKEIDGLNNQFRRISTIAQFLHELPLKRIEAYQQLIRYAKQSGPSLIVAPSQIEDAGMGVYVCGRILDNARIGAYSGLFKPTDEMRQGANSGYLLHHKANIQIDGGEVRCVASMVNDYRDKVDKKKLKANCKFCFSRYERCIRTKRPLENEEVLIFYGLSYRIRAPEKSPLSRKGIQTIFSNTITPIKPSSGIAEALQE